MEIRTLSYWEVRVLIGALTAAENADQDVHVSWQNGLQVKVGGGMWSAPMGKVKA